MAKKKAKTEIVELEGCEKCLSIECECDSCKLCEISGECICEQALPLIAEAAPEPVELHICADELCCIQEAPEPAVEAVEAVVLPEPEPASAGQGCWDVKYNMARRSKAPAVRKYIPVHRQR